jgi:hypothetical protein
MADANISLRYGRKSFDDAAAGIQEFARDLRTIWEGEVKKVSESLKEYLDHVARILAEKHGTPWPGGGGDRLSMRTGQGVASIIRSVEVKGRSWETLSGKIGGLARLSIHEYGGTIRGRKGLLTIPLPAALSARGTSPPFATQWKNTFVARSRKGNLIIFQRRPGGIVPLYVLKEQVYIPPRLGMRAELRNQIPYFTSRAVDAVVADVARQLGG